MSSLHNHRVKTKVRVLSTGKYWPKRTILSTDIDKKLNMPFGWTEKLSGVKSRRYSDVYHGESVSEMSALAIKDAASNAGISLSDIDCVVSACGALQQPIPCTASIIHKHLGFAGTGIPAFDINSTCLSFVTAIDMLSHLVEQGRFRCMAIASADIASMGLDEKNPETFTIFGDGAAAIILTKPEAHEDCGIIASDFATYSEGYELCQVKIGTSHHPRLEPDKVLENSIFKMDGPGVFKLAGEKFPGFVNHFLEQGNLSLADIKMIIPHQASNLGLEYIRNTLQVPHDKIMDIYSDHGNQVAASIPTTFHESIMQNKIVRGDTALLLGSSAGISFGALALRY